MRREPVRLLSLLGRPRRVSFIASIAIRSSGSRRGIAIAIRWWILLGMVILWRNRSTVRPLGWWGSPITSIGRITSVPIAGRGSGRSPGVALLVPVCRRRRPPMIRRRVWFWLSRWSHVRSTHRRRGAHRGRRSFHVVSGRRTEIEELKLKVMLVRMRGLIFKDDSSGH